MQQKFTIKQVKPNIFLFKFENQYEMAMHFLRFQEYYESPSPQFRGKVFEILDFMEWYSKKYGKGIFTYPEDWAGFNIPSEIILNLLPGITDLNKYDKAMWQGYKQCQELLGDKEAEFYIIGAIDNETLKHEIAHGFFHLIPTYKKEMTNLVKKLNPDFRKSFSKYLKSIGYTKEVFVDEIQAYLATGLLEESDDFFKVGKENLPFIKIYKKYSRLPS